MGARCSSCGGSVMPYRAYILHSRPTAVCDACGRTVRLEGWAGLVVAGGTILAALVLTFFLTDSIAVFAALTVALALLALGLDYAGYRLLRWTPVESGTASPSHPGAAPA